MTKTGLVLEGGGMRGIYTAGVLDVFMERGIRFDGVIGVSAGAIHGCSYLSEQMGRGIRYYKKYCNDPRFMSFRSLIKTGNIVGVDFCYHELPDVLDPYDHEAFLKNRTEFYVTCSNIETGKAEYLRVTDMKEQIDLVRASATLPYVSKIVTVGDRKYLDGGCTDSVPVDAFIDMGFERNVLILTRPATHVRQKEHGLMAKIRYRKYPEFLKALFSHHDRYNATKRRIAELEAQGSAFVIAPDSELEIGRLEGDAEKIQQVYDKGRADAQARIDEMIKWMVNENE